MIEGDTHYDILGIPLDSNADKIHRAYTSLLKEAQTIPDSPEFRAYMAKARVAYQVLSRPESRAVYHKQMQMARPANRTWEAPKEDRLHPALYIGFFTFFLGLPGLVLTGLYAWFTRKNRAAN
jgi:curved DNA-binding protein CbpA